jgi:hypothetical protein
LDFHRAGFKKMQANAPIQDKAKETVGQPSGPQIEPVVVVQLRLSDSMSYLVKLVSTPSLVTLKSLNQASHAA